MCCQAEWDIDVEPHIADAVATGRIIPVSSTPAPFVARAEDPSGVSLARTGDGWCGFRHDSRCSLQSAGGEAMLPSACRHFPRLVLQDARGTLVALSHFCPTAASLLFDDRPLAIVDAPPRLAPAQPIEGLDARDALPPLVRPGLLSDIEGYEAWEHAVVREFAGSASVARALERIATATELVRGWTPRTGPLATAVAGAFASAEGSERGAELSDAFGVLREVTGPHPLLTVPAGFVDAWHLLDAAQGHALHRPIANYMAACAFANWTAYRGQGLRTVVAWLRACYDVLRLQLIQQRPPAAPLDRAGIVAAFRMADFIVVHSVPSIEFGRAAAVFEQSAKPAYLGAS